MAAASVAAGADGLIVEVHPDPETALSDGYRINDVPTVRRAVAVVPQGGCGDREGDVGKVAELLSRAGIELASFRLSRGWFQLSLTIQNPLWLLCRYH